jgi:hypothetical protein
MNVLDLGRPYVFTLIGMSSRDILCAISYHNMPVDPISFVEEVQTHK